MVWVFSKKGFVMTIPKNDYQIIRVKYLFEIKALVGSNRSKDGQEVKRYFCADSIEKAIERFNVKLSLNGEICHEIVSVNPNTSNLILINKKSDDDLNGYYLFKLNLFQNAIAKSVNEAIFFSNENRYIAEDGLRSVEKSVYVNI